MKNWLWNRIVTHYDIVRDGASNVEIWTIKAPQSVLRQIDTIYEEVSFLEVYSDAIQVILWQCQLKKQSIKKCQSFFFKEIKEQLL